MKDRNWNEEYWLYRIQIYDYNSDKRETHLCAAENFDTAIELAKEYFGEDVQLCGVWELDDLLFTQGPYSKARAKE